MFPLLYSLQLLLAKSFQDNRELMVQNIGVSLKQRSLLVHHEFQVHGQGNLDRLLVLWGFKSLEQDAEHTLKIKGFHRLRFRAYLVRSPLLRLLAEDAVDEVQEDFPGVRSWIVLHGPDYRIEIKIGPGRK